MSILLSCNMFSDLMDIHGSFGVAGLFNCDNSRVITLIINATERDFNSRHREDSNDGAT
jgi:hypothetical protein